MGGGGGGTVISLEYIGIGYSSTEWNVGRGDEGWG